MKKGWIVVTGGWFWAGAKRGGALRVPPSWDPEWEKELKNGVAIYDPFFGYSTDEDSFVCSGVVMTEPFITPDGWTVELMLSGEFRKGFCISSYFPVLSLNANLPVRFLFISEPDLERLCSTLKDYELKSEFERLLNWALVDNGLETVQVILAERKCTDDEAKEVERVLNRVISIAGMLREKDDPALETELSSNMRYLMFLLHMENESENEWEKLWDKLCSAWRNYLIGSQLYQKVRESNRRV